MNPKTFATIACKVLALYGTLISLSWLTSFADSLVRIGSPSAYDNQGEIVFSVVASVIPFLVQLTFVVILWRNAEMIAEKMVPQSKVEDSSPLDPHQIYVVAFTIMGIFVLVQTFPGFCYQLFSWWATRKFDFGRGPATQRWLSLIVPGLSIVLALLLVFGAKGVLRFIFSLRKIIDERPGARKVANGA